MDKRLFVAINFPEEVKVRLAECTDQLRDCASRGNFTAPGNLHLTLAFIGQTDREEDIIGVLDDTVGSPFELTLSKFGKFAHGRGDIYWIGVAQSPALSAMQADITKRFRSAGINIEERVFRPHITLGREVVAQEPKIQAPQATFTVSHIELMQSLREEGRLVYKPLHTKVF